MKFIIPPGKEDDTDVIAATKVLISQLGKAYQRGWYCGAFQMWIFFELVQNDAPWWVLCAVVFVNIVVSEALRIQLGYRELNKEK